MEAGRILADLGRPEDGRDRTEKADRAAPPADRAESRRRRGPLPAGPGDPQSRQLRKRIRPDQGVAQYRAALDQMAILRRASHDAPLHVEWDARTRSNLGLLLSDMGRKDEAVALQAEAAAMADRIVAAHPGEITLLDALAACQNNLGEALEQVDRLDEAEAAFNASLAPYRTLAQRFPDETEFPWGIAMVQTNLASIQIRRDRRQDAVALLDQAGPAFDALLKVIPNNPFLRENADCQREAPRPGPRRAVPAALTRPAKSGKNPARRPHGSRPG